MTTDQVVRRLAWFPKSQIKDNAVPGWLIDAKAAELQEEERQHYPFTLSIEIDGLLTSGVRP